MKPPDAADHATAIDWPAVAASLDERGYATAALLTTEECRDLAALYHDGDSFRRRVVMQHHAYGRGEYKYFRYPLPGSVEALRGAIYPRLAPIANRWHERLHEEGRFPPKLEAYLAECHRAGQERPTPLILKYGAGDYNCLHQDLYGALVFPLQLTVLLSDPAADFAGGEFLLVEQRPRRTVARRGGPTEAGRGGDLSGAPSPGRRHPRPLSRYHAPRRQPHP